MSLKSSVSKTFLILVVAILVFLAVIAIQPSQYRISRSMMIVASPAAIFPHVNEPKKWEPWNPWRKLDPAMQLTYEGPPSGKDAAYSWNGNQQVGAGRMTVIESQPNERVRYRVEFYKPMSGAGESLFQFEALGSETKVTWTMTGNNNFIAKVFGIFMNMDKMVGGQFEKGLAGLKAVVEVPRTP